MPKQRLAGRNSPRDKRRSRAGTTYRAGHTTRAAILRESEAVLVELGHAGFSVRKVAERLGLAVGNVNYYFPTRDSLLIALIQRLLAEYRQGAKSNYGRSALSGARLVGPLLGWLVTDAVRPRTSGVFRQLWAIAGTDPQIAATLDRFYERSAHGLLRVLGFEPSRRAGPEWEALLFLVLVISEGSTVVFSTRKNSRTLLDRVLQLAQQAIVHLAEGLEHRPTPSRR